MQNLFILAIIAIGAYGLHDMAITIAQHAH